jgi:hypothetical protein
VRLLSQKTDKIKKSENTKLVPNSHSKLGLVNFILTPEQRKILETKNYLVRLYDTYKFNYLKSYIKHLEKEDALLQEHFPNVDFYRKARVKSKNNYIEKLRQKGEALDIFADKIIIVAVDGKTDEDLLVKTAYKMQTFLTTYSPNVQEIERKRKDYISAPKENGYASLHMTRAIYVEDDDVAFNHETQIKTFRMREVEKNGSAGHASVYKSNRDALLAKIDNKVSAEYFLPQYMHFEFDRTLRRNKIVLDTFDSNFKYYFGINFDDFMLLKSVHSR